jgi:NAD(P)-dependent dehydrogenase (short-subunit alcohol dehydrogenase family)
MVTAGGPAYIPLSSMKLDEARKHFDERLSVVLGTALFSRGKIRPGGSLLFVGGTGARRPGVGLTIATTLTNALPALIANLALELAPTRVNIVAPGFVDTPLSASLLGDQIDARRDELRKKLPIHRVVGPEDVAALAVHIMSNDALTGGTYDVDGGSCSFFSMYSAYHCGQLSSRCPNVFSNAPCADSASRKSAASWSTVRSFI